MESKKRWVAVVVIVVVMVGAMQAATIRPSVVNGQAGGENSDAPYLYYFSNDLNAWVIERADGTDRRLLGQGLMPDELDEVYGPGWSPTGKWFAWQGTKRSFLGPEPTPHAWIVSADGQTLAAEFTDVAEMHWSPTEDLLFLVQTNGLFYHRLEMVYARYSLFDPNTGTIIASVSTVTSDYDRWPRLVWTPDGQYAIARATNYSSNRTRYYVFDGTGLQRMALIPTIIHRPPSALGYVAYWTEHSFKIENILTGEHQTLSSDTISVPKDIPYTNEYAGQWSTTGQYALYVLRDGENNVAWLLDLIKAKWDMLTTCLLPGSTSYFGNYAPQFSPDDHYLAYFEYADCEDGPNDPTPLIKPINLDLFTGTSHAIPTMPLTTESSTGLFWVDETSLVLSALFTDAAPNHRRQVNVTIDAITENVSYFELPIDLNYTVPHFSPDGRYVASVWFGPVVLELETSQKQEFRPDSRGWNSISGGQILWHPDSEWLLIGDYALVAGGGTGGVWVSVMRPDGSGRRELNYCSTLGSCVDWLPAQVDTAQLPPVVSSEKRPVEILIGTEWVDYLKWSPDSRYIATNTEDGLIYRGFDIRTGEIIGSLEVSPNTAAGWATVDGQTVMIETEPEAIPAWNVNIFSPDGKWVLGVNGVLGVFDAQTGALQIELPNIYYVDSVAFSSDGRYMAISTVDYKANDIQIWDTQTWQMVGTLDRHSFAVAFSPNGEYLAVGVSWDVEIWRVSDLIGAGIQEN